jgi:hypothetical protein
MYDIYIYRNLLKLQCGGKPWRFAVKSEPVIAAVYIGMLCVNMNFIELVTRFFLQREPLLPYVLLALVGT